LRDASKPEIKAAVELLFKVQVEAVAVANQKGKSKQPKITKVLLSQRY